MRILISPDKFKGSLTARQVCDAIRKGINRQDASSQIVEKPMADGGEGSIELLRKAKSLKAVPVRTTDPLGRPFKGHYYSNDHSAFIELAAASGLDLLADGERNPMLTSSFGTGLMIRDALDRGIREIFLFIGGSATNDGGMGVAAALGYRFLDEDGNELKPIGKNLGKVHAIDKSRINRNLKRTYTRVICDVENPFFGPEGAAFVYAAQKGAGPQETRELDAGLQSFAEVIQKEMGIDISDRKGAGAAGGMGGGAIAFLGAELIPGIDFMMQALEVEEAISSADLIITGEGKIDHQTLYGKVVAGIARLARKHHKPCIAICGVSELSMEDMKSMGLTDIISMSGGAFTLEESLGDPARVLEEVVSGYFSEGIQV